MTARRVERTAIRPTVTDPGGGRFASLWGFHTETGGPLSVQNREIDRPGASPPGRKMKICKFETVGDFLLRPFPFAVMNQSTRKSTDFLCFPLVLVCFRLPRYSMWSARQRKIGALRFRKIVRCKPHQKRSQTRCFFAKRVGFRRSMKPENQPQLQNDRKNIEGRYSKSHGR